jgi:hypothetical protein
VATSSAPQISPAALDIAGVSALTAAKSATDPSVGNLWDPAQFAAAAPVWVHPMADGRFLMASQRRWYGATPSGIDPGGYSTYSQDTSPSWTIVDSSGSTSPVPNAPVSIPMNTKVDSALLVAGASRPPLYMYLLHAVSIGGALNAVLQHFHLHTNGAVNIAGEEVPPTVPVGTKTVVFNRGICYDTPYLVLYGSDTTGTVYRIRKPWARVGTNKQRIASMQVHPGVIATQMGWEYWNGTGYSADPTELAPVGGLSTVGPMSFASYGNQVIASTVLALGNNRLAQSWVSTSGGPFIAQGGQTHLGSVADGSYLGGTLQFMPLLHVTSALTQAVPAAIPSLVWSKTTGNSSSLQNTWNLFLLGVKPARPIPVAFGGEGSLTATLSQQPYVPSTPTTVT